MDLEDIVRSTPSLVAALEAARDVDPPDWLLGAGAVRTAVREYERRLRDKRIAERWPNATIVV